MIIMLRPDEVTDNWGICRSLLEPAFRQRVHTHTVDDYFPLLLNGEYQLWVAINDNEMKGALVTCIEEGTNAKVCNIMSLGGRDLKKWIGEVDTTITQFAAANDCYAVEAVTRKGFSKYVPDFVEDGVVYIKLTGIKNGQVN